MTATPEAREMARVVLDRLGIAHLMGPCSDFGEIELLCELALAEDALAREALPDHVDKYLLQAEMSKRIGKALDAIRAAGLIPDELGTKQDPPWRGPKGEQHEKA